jgi:hypothetical protein
MRPTWLLLQLANLSLAAASAYAFYVAPGLWFDQAQLYFCLAGIFTGALTSLLCGLSLIFGEGEGGAGIHGFLGLILAGLQTYWLFHFGLDTGILEFLRRALRL